ncbi:SMCs flexible hinge [Tylopilus felleus]
MSEAYRLASQNNTTLSEESLAQYHALKAQASILAVTERQSLETLGREEKTTLRTLGQLKTQIKELETKKNNLTENASAQDVRGRVVDLCKPIDAVVVDKEKTAIECIEYPRTQRARQATFLPLDTISVKPINDKCRSFTNGACLVVDVIQYEPAVEWAMYHILENLLDSRPFMFALDVATLASCQEYLNLDKWLADNVTADGVKFLRLMIHFL